MAMNNEIPPMFTHRYMAHAFGGYEGYRYANTREAFDHAIACGYRFLETDLTMTADGHLICSHGFDAMSCERAGIAYRPGLAKKMTKERFLSCRPHGMHTVDASFLYEKMLQYPDLCLELDMREISGEKAVRYVNCLLETFAYNEDVIGRLLIQVYSEKMFEAIDSVYHFPHYQYIIAMKTFEAGGFRDCVSYALKHNICAIALPHRYATKRTIQYVKQQGLFLLVYTVDSRKLAQEMLSLGADTICTNYIDLCKCQRSLDEEEIAALYEEYHQLPIVQNKIVFSSFHGRGFGGNPKYILLELLKQKEKKLDLVWLIGEEEKEIPDFVRTVPFHTKEAIFEIATAKVLVENQMKFPGFVKREGQFLVQSMCGEIRLKKPALASVRNLVSRTYEKRLAENFGKTDLVLSNSVFCTQMVRRDFAYTGHILQVGMPQHDLLLQDASPYKKSVCKRLGISPEKKLLLYAPTQRDDKEISAFRLDYEKLAEGLGEEWVVLVRMHPYMQNKCYRLSYSERVINASLMPDVSELLAASDMLVTDYSSIMFSYLVAGKPCFLYASDSKEYFRQNACYFTLSQLPFPFAASTEELLQAIGAFDRADYEKAVQKFAAQVGLSESGHAAKDAAGLIVKMTGTTAFSYEEAGAELSEMKLGRRAMKKHTFARAVASPPLGLFFAAVDAKNRLFVMWKSR